MKKTLTISAFTLIIGVLLFFGVVPPLVDNHYNHLTGAEPVSVSEAQRQQHESLFIADLHADSLLWGRDLSKGYSRGMVDVPRLLQGRVALQAFSVVTQTPRGLNYGHNGNDTDSIFWLGLSQAWPPRALNSLMERALLQANRLQEATLASRGKLRIITRQSELRSFLDDRQHDPELTAGWLTLEGAHALEGRLENLERLKAAGFRMLAPTHFFDTELAGSAHGLQKGGLTPLGREWIRKMDAESLIIDLAHASEQTIDEVLALHTRPLIVSHTGVKGTCDNGRNLSDRHLEAIAATGGLIGIGFWEAAVCGRDIDAIVRAIRYAVSKVGPQAVALGSDWDGAVLTPIDASQMEQLTTALSEAGFPQEQVAAIMGGNLRDFLLKNLPE